MVGSTSYRKSRGTRRAWETRTRLSQNGMALETAQSSYQFQITSWIETATMNLYAATPREEIDVIIERVL